MPWTREEKDFASLLIQRQNHSKVYKQNFVGSLTWQLFLEKPNLSFGTLISMDSVSKQPQQEGRKSQNGQEVDCKISWQHRCGERFCRKESEKVPPKTFPRTWSFMCIVG